VLVIRERLDGGMVSQAFAIQAVSSGAPAHAGAPVISLLEAVGLALLGGLVLNLMPACCRCCRSRRWLSSLTRMRGRPRPGVMGSPMPRACSPRSARSPAAS
jgi:hypothetical protein